MLLVDTAVFISAADRDEPSHRSCVELLAAHRGQLLTAGPVVPETAWLLAARLGTTAEVAFLRLVRSGELAVAELTRDDYGRCIELVERYADLPLGLVDASLVTLAEREQISEIATLNHRDFRVVRPRHVDAFTLLP